MSSSQYKNAVRNIIKESQKKKFVKLIYATVIIYSLIKDKQDLSNVLVTLNRFFFIKGSDRLCMVVEQKLKYYWEIF